MSDINLLNIKSYLVGNLRYKVYDNSFSFLIRRHILEQIEFRIANMNPECYNSGSCIKCGCKTTALQMANKACDEPCYPTMMDKENWERFKKGGMFYDHFTNDFWQIRDKKLTILKAKNYVENTSR